MLYRFCTRDEHEKFRIHGITPEEVYNNYCFDTLPHDITTWDRFMSEKKVTEIFAVAIDTVTTLPTIVNFHFWYCSIPEK